MNVFTSSNGVTVYVRDGGTVQFQHGTRAESCGILQIFPHSEWWQTLREFFRAEEDERLGRWRWPENPDYVVYPGSLSMREAQVVSEEKGCWGQWSEAEAHRDAGRDRLAAAAVAFFDAHPESEPWHEAKPGEVWLLTIDGVEGAYRTEMVSNARFFAIRAENEMTYGLRSAGITAGRRLWPVES